MFIRHKIRKKKHTAWPSIVFSFDVKFFYLTGDTKAQYKIVDQVKVHSCLRISYICPSDTKCFENSSGILCF